jgi:hypothetical protein
MPGTDVQIMNTVLAIARANGGELRKLPGGHWVYPGFKLRPGMVPTPSIRCRTIQALVRRGLLQFLAPDRVKVSGPRHRRATG